MIKTPFNHSQLETAINYYFINATDYDTEPVEEPERFTHAYYIMCDDDEAGCLLVDHQNRVYVRYYK